MSTAQCACRRMHAPEHRVGSGTRWFDPVKSHGWLGIVMSDTRKIHSLLNQSPDAAFPGFKRTWSFAVTPLDQLRLRLTDHDYDRLMQSAKPVPVPDRDAFLRDVAAELGQYEVV